MADFVAVIRKAVDGLANNTPENRAKVYEKARGAVVRQLENMKPRPPEELLRRQITKLDSAIAEVESEFAEALPALEEEDEGFAPAVELAHQPSYEEPEEEVAAEPVAHSADAEEYEADRVEPVYEEPHPVEAAPVAAADEAPVEEEEHAHAEVSNEAPYEEPEELYDAPEPVHAVAEQEQPQQEVIGTYFTRADEEPAYTSEEERYEEAHHHPVEAEPTVTPVDESVPAHWAQPVDEDDWRKLDEATEDDQQPHGAEDLPEDEYEDRNQAGHHPYAAAPVVAFEPEKRDEHGYADHRADVGHDPVFGGRQDYTETRHEPETPPKKAAVVEDFSTYFQDTDIDLPAERTSAMPRANDDPFETPKDGKDNKERTPWDDLDELIGYDGASSSNRTASDEPPSVGASAATPAYMVKKKPRRNYAAVVLALVGAGLLAGGGYALWMNRDALNDMVGGLVQSAGNGNGETSAPSTDSAQTQTPTPPATQQPPAAGQQTANNQAQPSGDDGSVTGTKFTQRLMADGTERDEGPAAGGNGQPVTAEGQSVYEQNVAPPATTETPAANGAAPAGTPATPAQPGAVAGGERMFLYEEVLGQTVPTAIQGSVAWTLQQENDSEGRPSPTVQGQITVPGRGLSALITFKRNTDPSLPASHLIEIVFSVAPGFEGGAIDSVQRIAMKSTEQDRGNALIAVPAKITDDFHMIALNDFPDAMKTNLELLKSRNWIDIPVSYRNGRRALLTLQKGPEGIAAFDAALRDWAAAAPATGQ